ncbi:RNA polymerases I and III subunit AC2 l(2)37Cg [Rhodnius prolixus]|uniref:DNA-directed RNA polymerases I and III subunit RPAC2 n=2 Tax=Rhodnius TaxID=13248 RepID=R4G2Y7_RHOPR
MKIAELVGDEDSDDKSRTFVFYDEGHTLGNALHFIISNYPEVNFCGYTIPHPAEAKMHLRIQSSGPKALDILQKGLKDLEKLCDFTLMKFDQSMTEYKDNITVEQ